MSTGRGNETSGNRVLRTKPSFNRTNTASPLTPRLAGSTVPNKRDPSPRRPFVKTASISRGPSPEKSTITPVRALAKDKSTPISSSRAKPKPGIGAGTSTPVSVAGTPGSLRNTPVLRPRLAAQPSHHDRDGTPNNKGPYTVGALPHPSPLAQEAIGSANTRPTNIDEITIRNGGPIFFHADATRTRELTPNPVPAPVKRPANFFYANGQKEEPTPPRNIRTSPPALSMLGAARPHAVATRSGTSEIGHGVRSVMKSPTLNAITFAHSPFAANSSSASPPLLSPALGRIDYLNTPSATLNIAKLRNERSGYETPLPRTPSPNALGFMMDNTPITPGSVNSPGRHAKSSSICVVPTESPNSARKRSATWAEVKADSSPFIAKLESAQASNQDGPITAPILQRTQTSPSMTTSPKAMETPQSPSREQVDFAAGARRERKVLDLEISNSSLLAINRSLEREMKKQKAELKRYRRLSRAGRFSNAMRGIDDDDGGLLPHIDGALVGRPSSPFQEDVSDMDVSDAGDSDNSDDGTDDASDDDNANTGRNRSKEDKQRARDEAQLRADLRKHRELLLDTARMNRSLHRCLTWTEDLIKDGKKALDRRIQSSEVKLGGRVIDTDDVDLDDDDSIVDAIGASAPRTRDFVGESQSEDQETEGVDDFTGIEAFLGAGPWKDRQSVKSDSTSRDSVLDEAKTSSTGLALQSSERVALAL